MRFTKMEGLGNDYIYINCLERVPAELPDLAVRLSQRRFGVGADGIICIKPGRAGDFTMEMYNADGSRGAMCGNGIRCVGKYLWDKGLTAKPRLTIDTDAGPRALELCILNGEVDSVTVDMGTVKLFSPVVLEVEGEKFTVVPANAGNPHGVIFCKAPEEIELERVGPLLETHPALGERRNIEFVRVSGWGQLDIRVWERGSGITLACGTGACAAFAAALESGLCGPKVEAGLPGGVLSLEKRGEHILMTGPARTVFEGEIPDPPKNMP